MKAIKKVEQIVKAAKGAYRETLVEKHALPRTHRSVVKLRSVERAIRQYYKVDTKVYYISEEYKELFTRETVRGFYNTKGDYAVVFVNTQYRANVTTLCHELTHAYQNAYMNKEYKASTKALHNKEVSYWDAWHEVHAREQAEQMCDYFLGYYDIAI